jgi:large conductance mechanosensitive channel
MIGGANFNYLSFTVNGAVFGYGAFLTAVINFLITALIIFILVKIINKIMTIGKKKEEEEEEETEKDCPYCFTKIHIDATRCPNCTSKLDE